MKPDTENSKCELCDVEKSTICEIKGMTVRLCEECCRKELLKIPNK